MACFFLDEFPEFTPQVLDSLRQPLETNECVIARANYRVSYPACIQLIAAMNPCRCGMAGEPGHRCARGPRCKSDYQARISGPLMDRIDLRIEVPSVSPGDLIRSNPGEPSASVATRVARARERQLQRYQMMDLEGVMVNAHCPTALIESVVNAEDSAMELLADAADKMKFSARAFHRIMKVARTLADLDDAEQVARIHFAEAISYRVSSDQSALAA